MFVLQSVGAHAEITSKLSLIQVSLRVPTDLWGLAAH